MSICCPTSTPLWKSYDYNTTMTAVLQLQFDCLRLEAYNLGDKLVLRLSYNYCKTPFRQSYDYFTTTLQLQVDCLRLSYNYCTTPLRLSYDTTIRLSYDYSSTLLRLQYDCIAIVLSTVRPLKRSNAVLNVSYT